MNQPELALKFPEESEIPNPDGPRADLPEIQLPGGSFSITEAAERLFKLLEPSKQFFVRDSTVMKLGKNEDDIPVLVPWDPKAARSDFEKFGRLVVERTVDGLKCLKPTICSTANAEGLLFSAEAAQLLPKVNGLINCPLIYECDGEVRIAGPGFDAHTKRLVTGGEQPEEVDLQTACSALLGILGDFDFQTDGDKSRAVASFISPALKLGGFLKYRVPADVAQADQSQAGKGYRQNVVAAIYNEKLSIVANRKGGVGSLDETFNHQLLQGRPFIQFDNLRGKLDSQALESFFTADGMFPCRTPFRVIVNVHAADFFIFLTSNGLETTRDLANRSAIIRIRKRPPEYSFKKYPEGDLLAHVRARQSFYLGCVFSVIREWHKAGKPRSSEARHDFKEWVQTMDWIVQNLLGLAPLMDGHLEAQQMVSNPDMVMLRQVCNAMDRGGALGDPQSATEIAEVCEAENIEIPGLRYTGDPKKGARQIGSCLGRLFDKSNSMEVEGYRVERRLSDKKRDDGEGYIEIKNYVFERVGNAQTPPPATAPGCQRVQSKPAKVKGEVNVEYPHDFRRDGVRGVSFTNNPHKCASKFQKEITESTGNRAHETNQTSTSHVSCASSQ